MENWIQLAMVKLQNGKPYLFRAPRFSVAAGDRVVVDTRGGEETGVVLFEDTFREVNGKVMEIVSANNAVWPLMPILRRITEAELLFDEDDWQPEKEESDDSVRAD